MVGVVVVVCACGDANLFGGVDVGVVGGVFVVDELLLSLGEVVWYWVKGGVKCKKK